MLPDGRPVAVTGSSDATVRVWDLRDGTAIGDPMTGHTSSVVAVATLVLPDGRPVAVTSSHVVRVWDLVSMTEIAASRLALPGRPESLAPAESGALLIGGSGLICVQADWEAWP